MDCNININHPTCFDAIDGRIDLDITNNTGRAFADWQNLPAEALLTNDGKVVYNLSRGEYNLIIFDDISQQSFKVIVNSPPKLNIDFIKIDEPKCIDDIKQVEVGWSGGKPPYRLSVGGHDTGLIYDSYYKIMIKPNNEYTIYIVDSNNCKIASDKLYYHIEELQIDIDIIHPKCSGCTAPKIKLNITGGKPPYKIGWFNKNNPNTPITTNKFELNNKLLGGKYFVSVIDSNDCYKTTPFVIDSPSPIKVTTKIKADYSYNQFFEPTQTNILHNLLLLKKSIANIDMGETIEISCSNGIQSKFVTVFDTGDVVLDNNTYRYYYISPGINSFNSNLEYNLIVNNNKYLLSNKLNNKENKILVGSFILSNNYSFAFNENDIIELSYNKYTISSEISHKYIVRGYYFDDTIVTVLTFLNRKNMDKILKVINSNATDNFFIRSLTTKKNNNLGNINLIISGGSGKDYSIKCVGNNKEQNFHSKGYLIIDNLEAGQYKLSITDGINIAEYHNNIPIANSKNGFTVDVVGSAEVETNLLTQETISKYKIDQSLLNNYNNRPERLPIFSNGREKTNLIVNIAPTDAKFTIVGDNYEYESVGYQTVNEIKPGVYSIRVYKKGYKDSNQDFTVSKNNLNIVTIILEKG